MARKIPEQLRQTERNVRRPRCVTWCEEIVGKRAKEATIMRNCKRMGKRGDFMGAILL